MSLYLSAVLFFAAFVWRERVTQTPMLALSLFRSVAFAAGNFTHMLMGGGLIVAMVSVPVFTIAVLGGSYFHGGLNLMRLTVMLPIGAIAGGYLGGWLGYQRTTAIGMALSSLGFFLMHFWSANIADPLVHAEPDAHRPRLRAGDCADKRRRRQLRRRERARDRLRPADGDATRRDADRRGAA